MRLGISSVRLQGIVLVYHTREEPNPYQVIIIIVAFPCSRISTFENDLIFFYSFNNIALPIAPPAPPPILTEDEKNRQKEEEEYEKFLG
jgi:hypothetical protein